jgi:hypothetical protein
MKEGGEVERFCRNMRKFKETARVLQKCEEI